MDNYIRFLESHLGEIDYGWSQDGNGQKLPFQIVKYKNGPFPGTVTYSTLGLSNVPLVSPVSEKQIRQELVFVAYSAFGDKNIPGILQQLGLMALKRKRAFLRGDVIGPSGNMFADSKIEAVYVSIPVYFPDSFEAYHDEEKTPIIQCWLVPITAREAEFIKAIGWNRFEDLLESINPDLIDFERDSIV